MFNQNNGGYSLADIAAATTGNNNGNGFFGNDGWWIILLFLFANGGWGGGWGGNTGTQSEISYGFDMNGLENGIRGIQNGLCDGFYAVNTGILNTTANLQSTMAQGFGGINTALLGLDNSLQRSGYESTIANLQNNATLMAQLNNMQAQEAACCCETKNAINNGFADLTYRIATQDCETRRAITDSARDIIENQNAGTRSILEFLTQNKIADLQAENQALKFAQSQSNQNAFLINQLAPKAIPAYLAPNPYTGAYYAGTYAALNATCA
jgi:hypothetical protein